ncbi:uncharacterized protein LOC128032559 [Gossypium raimondii]|uniref:uncharacterized protein LOC128032559 n=1 Tax=Gossypium raimondii TaxID=29730 RepID=UPI00227BA46A|nr:uncharacterized protein LOC128032559 [Gossypium raimondii]
MDPDRAVADNVESNAPAPAQGTAPEESRHGTETHSQDEAREAFLHMMNNWYTEFIRANPNVQPPPLRPIPQSIPVASQEYEREFVRLSKYAQECVPTEAIMCKRFEDGLNEDIRIFVGMLELKEFLVLVDRACKAEELNKEKRKAVIEAWDARKRPMSKSFQTQSKKFKDVNSRSTASTGILTEICGSRQHYIKDCPEKVEEEKFQNVRSGDTVSRGRPLRKTGNRASSKSEMKDTVVRPKTRTPARAYAIRTREDASSPNVITANLMLLPFDEFDLILGMDWLTLHDVKKYLRKGCEAYLAYVLSTEMTESKLESVPVVCEFSDVFPEELPRLPPIREVEFAIDLLLGTAPISITPYRMVPT